MKRFEPLLKSPEFGKSNHAELKKITHKLVVIRKVNSRKVFELKASLQGLTDPHDVLREIATPPDSENEFSESVFQECAAAASASPQANPTGLFL